LRRVAIDMKKQARGRTVRTAVSSLADQGDALAHRLPAVARAYLKTVLVLAADVDGISLVHEV